MLYKNTTSAMGMHDETGFVHNMSNLSLHIYVPIIIAMWQKRNMHIYNIKKTSVFQAY